MKALIAGALGLLLSPAAAVAGDFVDTRLVFIVGDDDFMHDAGVTIPPSQRFDIGDRPGYTELYDKRDGTESGRESRTHLVLHKAIEGYFPGLFTEAAVVLELNHARILTGDPRAIDDDGTYLRFRQQIGDGALSLLMMPFNTDRMRIGWFWDISWGGDGVFPGGGLAPGLELEWEHPWYDVHLGAKTSRIQFVSRDNDPRNGQIEAFYGVFGGFGLGRKDGGLRFDAEGGFFEKGRNPNQDVRGERVDSGGVSARLSYVDGLPFLPTNDTRLYSAQSVLPWNHPAQWQPGLRWRIALEAAYLGQVLEDDELIGGTEIETGMAGALDATLEYGVNRFVLRAIGRDHGFLFFDSEGWVPYQALPDSLDTTIEGIASLGYEHHFAGAHLTLGLTTGIQQPASISSVELPPELNASDVRTGRATIVFRRADMFDDTGLLVYDILPLGEEVLPVFGGRLHVQLDLAEGFALQGQVTLLHDPNRTFLEQDTLGVNSIRVLDDPLTIGAALMARAEF